MKVIYVSDSLGTPIHPRGIFNYSVSLIEILKQLGATVDLVVEDAPGFGLDGRLQTMGSDSSPAVNSVQLSEIHRYFNESEFSFRWPGVLARGWLLISRLTVLPRLFQIVVGWLRGKRARFVKNEASLIDFVPAKGEHLKNLDGFVLRKKFYSSSMTRAITGLSPNIVDAANYDIAVVDTPHFVKVIGLPANRIFAVVHDLIPLRDPTMDTNWRYLFFKKLQATLAMKSTLIFVSNYTRDVFHRSFPDYQTHKEIILYPAIRTSLKSGVGEAAGPAVEGFGDAPWLASELTFSVAAGGRTLEGNSRKGQRAAPPAPAQPWNDSLPYFATAVSDEPRKNVGILLQAFNMLKGRANVVIVGQIDAKRHLSAYTRSPPNVRFTGYVSEAEKLRIFQGASGVVFPSFAEGFGIPLVEGAVMGLPVLCSEIAVFREVAGDHAIYFDPYDAKSLAAAVDRTLSDPVKSLRKAEQLRESVLERFSQDAMARRLGAVLTEFGLELKAKAKVVN